jgi:hypothetical protein
MKQSLILAFFFLLPAITSAQSVDILYAGETYTPPFYQGGALWSGESTLKLFAVPQGLGDPRSLNYRWSRGTTVLGDRSGVGENTLSYTDDLFSKPQIFMVEIVKSDDTVLASNWVNLTPVAPETLVYESHPLYGFLWNREAAANYYLSEAETTFVAFPLFFTAASREDSGLSYSWRSKAGEDSTRSTVTYRIPEGSAGQSGISLKVGNPASVRQMAEKSFLVQFGNEN